MAVGALSSTTGVSATDTARRSPVSATSGEGAAAVADGSGSDGSGSDGAADSGADAGGDGVEAVSCDAVGEQATATVSRIASSRVR